MNARPPFIRHYSELRTPATAPYPTSPELMSVGSSFSPAVGLKRLGVHHEELAPGRRTSFPHAESAEEEFVYVLEGTPDVWIDGTLYRLVAGDGVGFPAGTGISHTFINNTESDVRLLVVGEANKPTNRIIYPVNLELKAYKNDAWWHDAPHRAIGDHDGKPDPQS